MIGISIKIKYKEKREGIVYVNTSVNPIFTVAFCADSTNIFKWITSSWSSDAPYVYGLNLIANVLLAGQTG